MLAVKFRDQKQVLLVFFVEFSLELGNLNTVRLNLLNVLSISVLLRLNVFVFLTNSGLEKACSVLVLELQICEASLKFRVQSILRQKVRIV